MEQKGFTLWFTGLSGAGKTTLARQVMDRLNGDGYKAELLDGDIIRTNLSKGLGFSKEDRDTNIRRIGFVCDLLTRNDVIAVASAISPYRAIRDEVRAKVGSFVEVFVSVPVEVCIERDVKGLYAKALSGEIKNFTGISDPYEEPESAEIVVHTDKETERESLDVIFARLAELGYLNGSNGEAVYTQQDEEEVENRLRALGYL
jgi:adenylylsulfate kinase